MAKVYKQFTQEELDKQYSPSRWVKRCSPEEAIRQCVQHCETLTKSAIKNLPNELNISFDESDDTLFYNIFFSKQTTDTNYIERVLIYIHGGYWTAGVLVNAGGFFAESLLSMDGMDNTCIVTLEYLLSPPNSMEEIVKSVLIGIAHLLKRFIKQKVYIMGFSAGAHLAALHLLSESQKTDERIAGYILMSGIYDLEPIVHSCVVREAALDLKPETAVNFSPMKIIQKLWQPCKMNPVKAKFLIIYGEHDSPEFHRQSLQFSHILETNSMKIQTKMILDEDHFSLFQGLSDPNNEATKLLKDFLL